MSLVRILFGLILFVSPKPLSANLDFSVVIDDPEDDFLALHADVEAAVLAAGARWAEVFEVSQPITLDVLVRLGADVTRAGGRSGTSVYAGYDGQRDLWEQGAAAKIRTGIDPNPGEPDVVLYVERNYLLNELWFDPNPFEQTAPVPSNRTDAVSVFKHEFGHALAFNGWLDWATGARPENFHSTFDALTVVSRGNFRFHGPRTIHLYGSVVPLTSGNIYHFGNPSGQPGHDLVPDLMNGVVFQRGTRYDLSAHTLAVLEDLLAPVGLTWERWSQLAFREHRAAYPLTKEGDGDGDGVPNLLEFLMGTDPRNPRSRETLSVVLDGSGVSVTFPLVRSVRGYRLQLQTAAYAPAAFIVRELFNPASAETPLRYQSFPLDPGQGAAYARLVPVAVSDRVRERLAEPQSETRLITGPTPVLQDCFICRME